MAVVKQPFPSDNADAVDKEGTLEQTWYYLLQMLWRRTGGSGAQLTPVIVTPGASPYIYDTDIGGTLVVAAGTVSEISIVRSAQNIVTGVIAGPIPMMRGDSVVITYAVAPTVTFMPSEITGSGESN